MKKKERKASIIFTNPIQQTVKIKITFFNEPYRSLPQKHVPRAIRIGFQSASFDLSSGIL